MAGQGGEQVSWRVITPAEGRRLLDDKAVYGVLELAPFFFNDTATTETYTLSLHDALPISPRRARPRHPQDAPQYGAMVVVGAARWRLVRDERPEHLPLFVGERCCSFGREYADLRSGAFLGRFPSTEDVPGGSSGLFAAGGNRLV